MTDDIRQAARFVLDADVDDIYVTDGDGNEDCVEQYGEAVALIARTILAEHPADTETPIDEAWLRSVGADDEGSNLLTLGPIQIRVQAMLCHVHGGPVPYPKTRGQLRLLCRGLGIELTEPEGG